MVVVATAGVLMMAVVMTVVAPMVVVLAVAVVMTRVVAVVGVLVVAATATVEDVAAMVEAAAVDRFYSRLL